jgi:hypothetical protein
MWLRLGVQPFAEVRPNTCDIQNNADSNSLAEFARRLLWFAVAMSVHPLKQTSNSANVTGSHADRRSTPATAKSCPLALTRSRPLHSAKRIGPQIAEEFFNFERRARKSDSSAERSALQ